MRRHERITVMARRQPWSRTVGLLMIAEGQALSIDDVNGCTFVPMREGDYIEPSFLLDETAAQQLIDELWQCGLRPTEGSGSAGALAAVERHLQDMRKLVFED